MSATERRVWYMQRLNLFGGLSKVEIEALAGQLHDRVLRKRQLILDPESRGDRIYLVKTGAVRVYQISQEGRELTTAILRPGQLLGTAALASISHQAVFAEALEAQTCVCDATADEFLWHICDDQLAWAKGARRRFDGASPYLPSSSSRSVPSTPTASTWTRAWPDSATGSGTSARWPLPAAQGE